MMRASGQQVTVYEDGYGGMTSCPAACREVSAMTDRARVSTIPRVHLHRRSEHRKVDPVNLRLVAYLRVSSDGQLDGFGLDVQEKACRDWARRHHYKIVATHTDVGVSGATDAADRPGLSAALLALQQPPEADSMIVAKLDRLARALTVQEAALAIAWRAGGRVFTADHGEVMQDDPDDPMRTALRQVVGVFAELDRRMVVKRLRDGRNAKQATGRKHTGSMPMGTPETARAGTATRFRTRPSRPP